MQGVWPDKATVIARKEERIVTASLYPQSLSCHQTTPIIADWVIVNYQHNFCLPWEIPHTGFYEHASLNLAFKIDCYF